MRGRSGGPDPSSIHVPFARAIVDCGVYADGQRLPGKYTPAAALEKVRELGRGFVWTGLHGPDEHQMQTVADTWLVGKTELTVDYSNFSIDTRASADGGENQ